MDVFASVKQELRRYTIAFVLDFYDGQIRKLPEASRREKYEKMSLSPFRFFRGSSHLFYYDLTKIPLAFDTEEGFPTFIQGDLHFENFGVFGDGGGNIIYDVNDFDEGYLGSYLYDVMRMAISVDLFARETGFDSKAAIEAYARHYARTIRKYAAGKKESVQFTKDNTCKPIKKLIKKAEEKRSEFLAERTEVRDEERYFATSEDLEQVTGEMRERILQAWPDYLESLHGEHRLQASHYKIKDIAFKYDSGTASIGLERYYILIEGFDEEHEEDVILEMKEAQSAVPSLFLPTHPLFQNELVHDGARVIATQRAMVHSEDPYLGYLTIDHKEYYVRERSPYKKRLKVKNIKDEQSLIDTLIIQAQITAKIHARADDDAGLLPYESSQKINEAIGEAEELFVRQIVRWAHMYSEQVQFDYVAFKEWLDHRDAPLAL